ncbi:MAG: hypothetical protein HC876_16750 [Chloroflexaceae bacterium]|nr:hypothetical protein [Chloroflexaceae bacterium]
MVAIELLQGDANDIYGLIYGRSIAGMDQSRIESALGLSLPFLSAGAIRRMLLGAEQVCGPIQRGVMVIEAGAIMSANERAIAELLLDEGRHVTALQRSNVDPTPDFLVDGIRVELKTLTDLTAEPSKVISNRIRNAASQAAYIIIDARQQPQVTAGDAYRGWLRAINAEKAAGRAGRIQEVRIIGANFDFNEVYDPSK